MKTCCNQLNWEFIQDASHARGCEFTYGKCTNCGSHLIHLFYTAVVSEGGYEVVSSDFISAMQKLEGAELKQFMKNWYDQL
jgi:hypothetical protein